MTPVSINKQRIGDGHACYFLAEIGGNYGSVADVHTIVDVCVDIGINAIKFQTFEAATVTTPDNMFDLEITGKISQVALFQEYEPPKELQRELMRYAGEKGITAFSAPSHLQDLDFLEQLNMPAYKIGSDLACHMPLLREVAQTRKPILLSTGMATLEEIHASVEEVLKVHDQLILLHCVSDYPTHAENVNLKTLLFLKEEFKLPIGFSDHSVGPEIALAAVALGANAVERHFWVPGCQQGPDVALCSDTAEYQYLIKTSRRIESALGQRTKMLSAQEKMNRETNRVGIVAVQNIGIGQPITPENVDIRRPGFGIPPSAWDQVLGSISTHPIKKGQALYWRDIDRVENVLERC